MSLLEHVRLHLPDFDRIEENPIFNSAKNLVGWNSIVYLKSGFPIAGGTHVDKETAFRIAIAETLERLEVLRLAKEAPESVALDELPDSTGFAAGFDEKKTRFRSVCEAVERWTWSKWIDQKYNISKVLIKSDALSAMGRHFINEFDSVEFFESSVNVELLTGEIWPLVFAAVVGYRENGAFPGSRVTGGDDDLWTHAIVEAKRNYRNFRALRTGDFILRSPDKWLADRCRYFGENAAAAREQVWQASTSMLPVCKVKLHKKAPVKTDRFYLYRTLCADFLPWHLGPVTRFVY